MQDNFDNIINSIKGNKSLYLGRFGAFVKSEIISILMRRSSATFNQASFDILLDDYQEEFMNFMIASPEHFITKFKYPFSETLLSIKIIRENPSNYENIKWLDEKTFIDIDTQYAKAGDTIKVNSLKSIYYKEKNGDSFVQYSQEDIALAMMDATDLTTLRLAKSWRDNLIERTNKKIEGSIKHKQYIENAFSGKNISKSLRLEHYIAPKGKSLTALEWKKCIRHSVKIIFHKLNAKTPEKAFKEMVKLAYGILNNPDNSREIVALDSGVEWLKNIQDKYKVRHYIPADELYFEISKDILNQLSNLSLKNKIYSNITIENNRIERMGFKSEEVKYLNKILLLEKIFLSVENKKPKKSLVDLVIELKLCNASSHTILKIIDIVTKSFFLPSKEQPKSHLDKFGHLSKKDTCDLNSEISFNLSRSFFISHHILSYELPKLIGLFRSKRGQVNVNSIYLVNSDMTFPYEDNDRTFTTVFSMQLNAVTNCKKAIKSHISHFFSNQNSPHLLARYIKPCLISILENNYIKHKEYIVQEFKNNIQANPQAILETNFIKSTLVDIFQHFLNTRDIDSTVLLVESDFLQATGKINSYNFPAKINDITDKIVDIEPLDKKIQIATFFTYWYENADDVHPSLMSVVTDNIDNLLKSAPLDEEHKMNILLKSLLRHKNIDPFDYMLNCREEFKPFLFNLL